MVEFWRGLGYAVRAFIMGIGAIIAIGLTVLWLTGFFGTRANEVNNRLYNTSPTHLQGVAQDLGKDCAELATTSGPDARVAIDNAIAEDLNGTSWPDVQQYLYPTTIMCVNTAMAAVNG